MYFEFQFILCIAVMSVLKQYLLLQCLDFIEVSTHCSCKCDGSNN